MEPNREIPLAVFDIGDQAYAIHLDHLVEILLDFKIDPLPHLAGSFVGAISFPIRDGTSIPVVDLASLLGLPGSPVKRYLLVTEENGKRVGLLVDSPTEIVRVHANAISPLPVIYDGPERAYLESVVRIGTRLLGLIRPIQAVETIAGQAVPAGHGG
jgi:purine-binding chemotaxis protein CheW